MKEMTVIMDAKDEGREEGIEIGIKREQANTERERKRADAAEARANSSEARIRELEAQLLHINN